MLMSTLVMLAAMFYQPMFPPEPVLVVDAEGWTVFDSFADGTGLETSGSWDDMPLLREALQGGNPKPGFLQDCYELALSACGPGKICWVIVQLDLCYPGCQDGNGNCPTPPAIPPPAAPLPTKPVNPPSVPN